ncbi:MAG TPA: GNAT family protein [Anaerolineaceae bacterium]|nr:GNAT family protein [Anaerolineaceae bacterium]
MVGEDPKELMSRPLFVGQKLFLTPEDLDQDLPVEARWTEDPAYLALIQPEATRPLSVQQLRKQNRPPEDAQDQYIFAMRLLEDHRLVGIVELRNVLWTHGFAWLRIRIGSADDRGQGLGTEALQMILRYGFSELNLHRMTCTVFEYNQPAVKFFEKAGFAVEVRQREAIQRFGRRWDLLLMGMLNTEWEARNA